MNNFLHTAWWVIHPTLIPLGMALAVCLLVLLTHLHMHPRDRFRMVAVTLQKVERVGWWLLGTRGYRKSYVRTLVWTIVPSKVYDRLWNGMYRLDVRRYHRLAASVGESCLPCIQHLHLERNGQLYDGASIEVGW